MLWTLVMLIVAGGVLIAFFDEFSKLFQKIGRIPGMQLLLPIIMASWLLLSYFTFFIWIFDWLELKIQGAYHLILMYLPYHLPQVALFILQCVIPLIPVIMIRLIIGKKPYAIMPWRPVCLVVWIGLAVLLVNGVVRY